MSRIVARTFALAVVATALFPSLASAVSSNLLIVEVQTRGSNGGGDEFVTLYNMTASPIVLTSWKIEGRSFDNAGYTTRWTGVAGNTIPAYGFWLITASGAAGYNGAVATDSNTFGGIKDAGSLRLVNP